MPKLPVAISDPQDGERLAYDAAAHAWRNDSGVGAVTATTGGAAVSGPGFFAVASDDANKIVVLPAPTPGGVVALRNGATGYELRTSAPATVAINGGSGANAESAIPADTLTVCFCDTGTTWLCSNTAADGTAEATEVAAP